MRRKVLLILAAVVLLGVAAWAIWGLGSSLQDQAEQDTIFERLRKISTEDVPTDLGTSSNSSVDHSHTENDVSSVAEPEVYRASSPPCAVLQLQPIFWWCYLCRTGLAAA